MRRFSDGETITIEPWRAEAFPVLRDLVVDRGAFDRIIAAGGYISVNTGSAPEAHSAPVPKVKADRAFDAATCIGCGACVAACPNAAAMLFLGAKVTHLGELPQGQPERDARVVKMLAQHDARGLRRLHQRRRLRRRLPEGDPARRHLPAQPGSAPRDGEGLLSARALGSRHAPFRTGLPVRNGRVTRVRRDAAVVTEAANAPIRATATTGIRSSDTVTGVTTDRDPALAGFHAVVPAGGAGTRLWPLSRAAHPKFLLDLTGNGRSLLQQTWDRLYPLADGVVVVTGASHAKAVAEQLPELPASDLLAEPSPRDSAAAIGLAAAVIHRRDPSAVIGSFAADHVIRTRRPSATPWSRPSSPRVPGTS